jgi:predicted TIM-barrel fold metal-dependent hydrolase
VPTWRKLAGLDPGARRTKTGSSTLLPDPEPRQRLWPIISVDDHVVEPPWLFEGRLPSALADRAPRIVEDEHGNELWQLEGRRIATIGLSAAAGRPAEDYGTDPSRFDEMRRGCFDIHARVADMDLAGVYAALCFPSFLPGFAGLLFNRLKDRELGLALIRAWNDWHIDEWAGTYPGRMIACQLPWLHDVELAAEEVRRNAARGFKAISWTENPVILGLPSIHTDHWDPFFAACQETGTVICLHGGSSGWSPVNAPEAPVGEFTSMFLINPMVTTLDWVWSAVGVRFPDIRVVLSESGISWVPAIIERLDYVMTHSLRGMPESWPGGDLSPSDVLRRNLWFSSIYDPIGISLRHHIGVENILLETDYPHSDSTWPDTQRITAEVLAGVSDQEARMITCENAADLFRHPLPDARTFPVEPAGKVQA